MLQFIGACDRIVLRLCLNICLKVWFVIVVIMAIKICTTNVHCLIVQITSLQQIISHFQIEFSVNINNKDIITVRQRHVFKGTFTYIYIV